MILALFGFIFLAWLVVIGWLIVMTRIVAYNTKEMKRIEDNISRLVKHIKSEEEALRDIAADLIKRTKLQDELINIIRDRQRDELEN